MSSTSPIIVAEIGINHGGSLNHAIEIVDEFLAAGARYFKTQIHCFDDEYHPSALELKPPNANENIVSLIKRMSLTPGEEIALHDHIRNRGGIYISTAFSRKGVEFLDHLGVEIRKIGSGEIGNLPLISKAIIHAKRVIASTGLHSPQVVGRAAKLLTRSGVPTTILACTNLYPTRPEESNLAGIETLKKTYPGFDVGFSDHTVGTSISLAAIARGASLIERHICLENDSGPDIAASLTPVKFKELLQGAEAIYEALTNPRDPDVTAVARFAQSSLVATRDLEVGVSISEQDLWALRPGTGDFRGWESDEVIGKTVTKRILGGDFISRASIE